MEKPQLGFGVSFVIYRLILLSSLAISALSQNDAVVMNILKKAINAPPNLMWTDTNVCKWEGVDCNSGKRVISIQIANLNLQGLLPKELENLSELQRFDCRQNGFTGPVPYLSKTLQRLVIRDNKFSSIPNDFFKGMTMLQEVRIGNNPFSPWSIPDSLEDCVALQTFVATNASLVGTIPDFLGTMTSLVSLVLNYNSLEGGLPASFAKSSIEQLWLNTQNGNYKLNGTIMALQDMTSLKQIWLHGNSFTGPIPDLPNHDQLSYVSLRDNQLACAVPSSLKALPSLQVVNLTNNFLQGPIPSFKSGVIVDMSGINRFCTNIPNQPCSPLVNALLSVVEPLGCPVKLADNWKGNDPCNGSWTGIVCAGGNISIINFQNMGLSGTISPTFALLTSVTQLLLANNSLTGPIPKELTTMPNLRKLDVSNNNLGGFVPSFHQPGIDLRTKGNPDLGKPLKSPSSSDSGGGIGGRKNNKLFALIVGIVVSLVILLLVAILVFIWFVKKRNYSGKYGRLIARLIGPRDGRARKGMKTNVSSASATSQADVQGMVIPIQVLKEVTNNFNSANILGRGGFGTVYKGELRDGTKIAVKRMESGLLMQKGLSEFQTEITVLTQARHKHLVALLGYCLDGNEKLLVYEYMPQGALSKHLFSWKENGLEPLDWTSRLNIALDVARGVEYLHALAQQSFIHRDLKPSNILLGRDMRAKVSDFGLVRLAPEGRHSIETRLAGTFGYLAPEYAGRVTTKVDVYSFGVVLMEMITGRRVLDNSQPDEDFHLVTWFRQMMQNNDSLQKVVDPTIDANDEGILSSIRTVSELAGHCCASEPKQRPDMGHVVNVLSPLIQAWKPQESSDDGKYGLDLEMSLPQALKKWKSWEGNNTIEDESSSQSFLTK